MRPQISDYDPNDREAVRRAYLLKGPCQPTKHNFPKRLMSGKNRWFKPQLFEKHPSWLEYSIEKDAAFCLPCYLFRPQSKEGITSDAFIVDGFRTWSNIDRIDNHVGNHNSPHNEAMRRSQALMNQAQQVQTLISKQLSQDRIDYRTRLTVSLDVIRLLLCQGIAFRGHNERKTSSNQGNFLEILRFLAEHNESIDRVVLENAPENLKLTSHDIQKELVNACAIETTNVFMEDIGQEPFAILIDEARDISVKEQMAIVLRYVDKKGYVIERFAGVIHVHNTSATSLRTALKDFLSKHNLSITRLRGQGYDGARNMQGKFGGLKTLILKENKFAFFVHCFAHQLQLALVHATKGIPEIASFFTLVSNVVNLVLASPKRMDNLRNKEAIRILNEVESGELETGSGLNQEIGPSWPGETRWGSHYRTLVNLSILFPSMIQVLEDVIEDATSSYQRGDACILLKSIYTFEFVFTMHLMTKILAITNELSLSLQRKDQDIVNAMNLVKISKDYLHEVRESGWDELMDEVSSYCLKHEIDEVSMSDIHVPIGKSMRGKHDTNLQYYQHDLFHECIDRQRVELDQRFDEVNTELVLCMASLSPSKSFAAFDGDKLIRLVEFYTDDFSESDRVYLRNQLNIYIRDMKSNNDFSGLKGIGDLSRKMVEKGKNEVYNFVYRLIKLSLILPVATATVERAFSAMNIVKNRLRNRMGDEWMNDCLVTYIEKDIFRSIDNERILQRYQHMKPRREQL